MSIPTMTKQQRNQLRLIQQRLTRDQATTAAEVVGWMGAVQAQDYLGTKWALGMRMQEATDDALEQAFHEGRILRTHVMRPTWHFVTPDDIRWLLELTGPRVNALSGTYYRQVGLDEATMRRSNEVIARTLQGGHFLTRAEVGAKLEAAGIKTEGLRLGFLMMRAELDAIVCSGPRRGKQQTYALLDERAPHAKSLPHDAALAELAHRYFTSHGPATLHDFAWWSGLTLADVKQGLVMAKSAFETVEVDGQLHWLAPSTLDAHLCGDDAFLLPTFDEFLVGYSGYDEARRSGGDLLFESTIVLGGQVVGSWKRTLTKREVVIELAPFAPLPDHAMGALHAAAQRYGQFVALPVAIKVM